MKCAVLHRVVGKSTWGLMATFQAGSADLSKISSLLKAERELWIQEEAARRSSPQYEREHPQDNVEYRCVRWYPELGEIRSGTALILERGEEVWAVPDQGGISWPAVARMSLMRYMREKDDLSEVPPRSLVRTLDVARAEALELDARPFREWVSATSPTYVDIFQHLDEDDAAESDG